MTRKYFRKEKSSSKGFTLAETLVTIFIFTTLMGGVTLLLKNIFYTFTQQSLQLDNVDQARIDLFTFTNEMRNAAYGNEGSYPFNQASSSQLIFFSTFGATGTNVNRIRYFVASSTLYKGVIVPSGSPLTYTGAEKVTPILTGLASTSVFAFYNGTYAGTSSALSQPINVNNVKYVQINMTITDQSIRNSTSTFLVSGGAAMRNLKINLGN